MGDMGFVQRAIGTPVVQKYGNKVFYQRCAWTDWGSYMGGEWDMIIGHSLGGESAINFCRMRATPSQPKLLMTLAPRWQSNVSWFDMLYPFQKPFAAPNMVTHNFLTYGFMPSYPVLGARENTNVTSLTIWHANVPSAPAVQKLFWDTVACSI